MRLISILVGTPRTVGVPGAQNPMEREFTSAIWKSPVNGPVHLGPLGLAGDAVADTRGPRRPGPGRPHVCGLRTSRDGKRSSGGPWSRARSGRISWWRASTRTSACIGDVYEIGEVRLQVSHPRQPCATLARRHQIPDMIAIVRQKRAQRLVPAGAEGGPGRKPTCRSAGWTQPNPEWSVRRAARAMLTRDRNPTDGRRPGAMPGALATRWRTRLLGRRPSPRAKPYRSASVRVYTTPLTNHPPRRPHQARGDSDRRKVS